MDANCRYFQIEMDPRDIDKTVFVTSHNLLRHTRMPFGVENGPETFQWAMDVVLASAKWQFQFVNIIDIIVFFSWSPEKRLEDTEGALWLMREVHMTIKLKNCYFFCESIDYTGHLIARGKLIVRKKPQRQLQQYDTLPRSLRWNHFLDFGTSSKVFCPVCKDRFTFELAIEEWWDIGHQALWEKTSESG